MYVQLSISETQCSVNNRPVASFTQS